MFKEKCRNPHHSETCETPQCDKKCLKKHPRQCRHGEECKFLTENICIFNQNALSRSDGDQHVLMED